MQYADDVKITFASLSKNELLARSFAAAYAAQFDPTVRELEDIKTAISEAVTNVVVHAYPDRIGQVDYTGAQSTQMTALVRSPMGWLMMGLGPSRANTPPNFPLKV